MDLSTVSLKSATTLSETHKQHPKDCTVYWVQKFSSLWRSKVLSRGRRDLGATDGTRVIESCSAHSHHLQKLRSLQPFWPSGPEPLLKLHLPRIRFPASEWLFLSSPQQTAVTWSDGSWAEGAGPLQKGCHGHRRGWFIFKNLFLKHFCKFLSLLVSAHR